MPDLASMLVWQPASASNVRKVLAWAERDLAVVPLHDSRDRMARNFSAPVSDQGIRDSKKVEAEVQVGDCCCSNHVV